MNERVIAERLHGGVRREGWREMFGSVLSFSGGLLLLGLTWGMTYV